MAKAADKKTRRIRVGTASWQDPGFLADWYPKGLPKSELLPWYAEHFNLVEVNSTFYHVPERGMVERWIAQTPKEFTFDIKLHKLLSRHSTKPEDLPAELRRFASSAEKRVELTPDLTQATIEMVLEATEPLERAGKLGAYLLQMSPAFRPRYHKLDELLPIIEAFAGKDLALELRNRDWLASEIAPAVLDFCEDHAVSLVMTDSPESGHFTVMPEFEAVTNPSLAYLRLHGRNAEGYVRGRSVAERFDYDYSEDELRDIAVKVKRVAGEARETHAVFNNNVSNYAPKAAEAFQKILEEAPLVAA